MKENRKMKWDGLLDPELNFVRVTIWDWDFIIIMHDLTRLMSILIMPNLDVLQLGIVLQKGGTSCGGGRFYETKFGQVFS